MDNPQSWVKVISIIGIVLSALGVAGGIALILGGSLLGPVLTEMIPTLNLPVEVSAAFITGIMIIFGVFLLIFEIFMIIVYTKLLKYTNWARIVVIIVSAFGVLGIFRFHPMNVIMALYSGLVFYMLTFQKEIVDLFIGTKKTPKKSKK